MTTWFFLLFAGFFWGSPAQSVSILTFNSENLFDHQHDKGKDDYTYLPLEAKKDKAHRKRCQRIRNRKWQEECLHLDWNDATVKAKQIAVASVLKASFASKGADVIILQEIENLAIAEALRNQHLKGMGYLPAILIEGHDRRGIDTAILTRLPLVGHPSYHRVPKSTTKRKSYLSRGILGVDMRLPDNSVMRVFAVHFPSPMSPRVQREDGMRFLNQLAAEAKAETVVAAGDFNVKSAESGMIFRGMAATLWKVSHLIGCQACSGTHFYSKGRSWSFLDAILVLRRSRWQPDPKSIHIVQATDNQKTKEGYPQRFDPKLHSGVSDHFPLGLTLMPPNPPSTEKKSPK